MFHRVKPENEQDEKGAADKAEKQPQPAEKKTTAQSSFPPEAFEQKKQGQPQKTTSQTPAKENQPMSDQKDNKKAEGGQASQDNKPLDIPAGAYGRGSGPGQGGYPGASYGGNAPYGAKSGGAPRTSERGSLLTIGRGITMSGEIEACDHLIVEGTVEAALKGAQILEVEESGVFYGTVEIEEATIAGRFEGDITVKQRLTIRSGGIITGSITYGELEIEAGATIDGRITPMQGVQSSQGGRPKAVSSPAKAAKSGKDERPQPANSDGELFSDKAAAAE